MSAKRQPSTYVRPVIKTSFQGDRMTVVDNLTNAPSPPQIRCNILIIVQDPQPVQCRFLVLVVLFFLELVGAHETCQTRTRRAARPFNFACSAVVENAFKQSRPMKCRGNDLTQSHPMKCRGNTLTQSRPMKCCGNDLTQSRPMKGRGNTLTQQ